MKTFVWLILEELFCLCPFSSHIAAVPFHMKLAFMWFGIGVFDMARADTLDFAPMAMSFYHIERSHYFTDFAVEAWVYGGLGEWGFM